MFVGVLAADIVEGGLGVMAVVGLAAFVEIEA